MAGRAIKIHLAVDAHGKPIIFILSDGTTHNVKVAPDLVDKIDLSETDRLCADKGYDSDPLQAHIEQAGCFNSSFNNSQRKQNAKSTNDHMNWHLYKV